MTVSVLDKISDVPKTYILSILL